MSRPRSFIVLDDSNDYADCGRDTKFNPLVLDEIQAADDTNKDIGQLNRMLKDVSIRRRLNILEIF